MNLKTTTMTEIALMTAVMCILGPLSIPIGPVPISLTPLAVFLGVYILGTKKGVISFIVYLLIGIVGVPVFSGFAGGVGKAFGPTGGYLLGFIFMGLIGGFFIHKYYKQVALQFVGMVLGLIVVYIFGSLWLAYQAHMTLAAAFAAGVIPFVVVDLLKIAAAIAIGRPVRSQLMKAGFLK